jgi:hypothetical protein
LNQFCSKPSFKIISIANGINFDMIYDFCIVAKTKDSFQYETECFSYLFEKFKQLKTAPEEIFPSWFPIKEFKQLFSETKKITLYCKNPKHLEIRSLCIQAFSKSFKTILCETMIHNQHFTSGRGSKKLPLNDENEDIICDQILNRIHYNVQKDGETDLIDSIDGTKQFVNYKKLELIKKEFEDDNFPCKTIVNPNYKLFIEKVASNIKTKETCSDYRKVKTFLRAMVLIQKGISCINFDQFVLK